MNLPGDGQASSSFTWLKQLEGALAGEHPALRKGNLPLEFHARTLPGNRVAVVGVRGHEEVNGLYQYDVELVTPLPPEALQPALFGLGASLLMRTPEHDARVIQGIVGALEICGVADRGLGKNLFRYVVTLVPPMWLWTQRRRNRVFQNKTLPDLIEQLLKEDKIVYDLRLDPEEYKDRARALYYQRDETDYAFFKRILADAGLFFFFQHAAQDSLSKGVMSTIGSAAGGVAGAGSALSGFGAPGVGSTMGEVGAEVQKKTHSVTCLIIGEDEGGATPLQDFAAVNGMADFAVKKGLDAMSGVTKAIGDWAGKDALGGGAGIDASDEIKFDDGSDAALGDERVYSLTYRHNVRPKSVWSLERDARAPKSWAHRETRQMIEPKLQLDVHLAIGRDGLHVDDSVSVKLDADAPIAASKLEHQLIDYNAGWITYPSETHPHKSEMNQSVIEHTHLKRPLEQLRHEKSVLAIDTDCRRLGAGYRFMLSNHPSEVLNDEYTVRAMNVDALDPEMLELDNDDVRRRRPYIASLTCIPADQAPRPPIHEKKKLPMELGTVVRWFESADMVSVARGEVLVRLAWDLEDDGRDRPYPISSDEEEREAVLTVPVLLPWAGEGYGLQVTPREGMQVVVGYLDDQGDRPVILGCLHSNSALPPWSGPDAVKVGFRTQSRWPRGTYSDRAKGRTEGWSEISIDDTGNHELVQIRAERNMTTEVIEDHTLKVGANAELLVGKDSKTNIVGKAELKVQDDASVSLQANAQVHVGGDLRQNVEGTLRLNVNEALSEQVNGDVTSTVLGDFSQNHVGHHTETFGDDYVARHAGHRTIIVGADKDKRSVALHVNGSISGFASETIEIEAEKGLTIRCGNSYLIMRKDAVTIQSPSIVLTGKTVEATGSDALNLNSKKVAAAGTDEITLTGKKATLSSDSASVALDSNATIQGSAIKLGRGSGATADKKEAKKQKVTKIKLVDKDDKPLSNSRVLLRRGGEDGVEQLVILDKDGTKEVVGDEPFDVRFPDQPDAKAQ